MVWDTGVLPTVIRQGSNQAVNFTCYQAIKDYWMNLQGTNTPFFAISQITQRSRGR